MSKEACKSIVATASILGGWTHHVYACYMIHVLADRNHSSCSATVHQLRRHHLRLCGSAVDGIYKSVTSSKDGLLRSGTKQDVVVSSSSMKKARLIKSLMSLREIHSHGSRDKPASVMERGACTTWCNRAKFGRLECIFAENMSYAQFSTVKTSRWSVRFLEPQRCL